MRRGFLALVAAGVLLVFSGTASAQHGGHGGGGHGGGHYGGYSHGGGHYYGGYGHGGYYGHGSSFGFGVTVAPAVGGYVVPSYSYAPTPYPYIAPGYVPAPAYYAAPAYYGGPVFGFSYGHHHHH